MPIVPDRAMRQQTSRIPRRVPHRVAYFEALWTAVEHDVLSTVDDLRASGWTEAAIADCMTGYCTWFQANVADAVELGRIAGGVAA